MPSSFVPTGLSGWVLLALAAGPPIVAWVAGAWSRAWREAWRHEPRMAQRALHRWFREIARRGSAPTKAELETWRGLVARRCDVAVAAPDAREIATRATDQPDQQLVWQALWAEAEAALYSRRSELPADWLARAGTALGRLVEKPRGLPVPCRWCHWLPFIVVAACVLTVPRSRGVEPALAAAQATKAFVRSPGEAGNIGRLREALARLDVPDPTLTRVFNGSWRERWVGWRSPAQWERLARATASAAGALFTLALVIAYARGGRRVARIAFAGGVLAGAVAAAGFVGVQRYGVLARPRAAFVVAPVELRQQPTDIGDAPAILKLGPGRLVEVERTFLGWDRVVAGGGSAAGWLRTENVVWLYRERENASAGDEISGL